MKKPIFVLLVLAIGLLMISGCSDDVSNPIDSSFSASSIAKLSDGSSFYMEDDDGHPWGNHAKPWNFLWENGLDNNHELKMIGNDKLLGFMYISFTDGDTATGGQDVVGWTVQGKLSEAHWSATENKWIVSAGDVPNQPGFMHWHPIGDEGAAQGMESATGYFLKHTATMSFYFAPQNRWVAEGIDFDFPNNYMTE